MSDITLFQIKPTVAKIDLRPAKLEKDVQDLIENNMESFFGVRFLKTEYVINHTDDIDAQGGRIDSLGIDENNCPIIFEYKRNDNENVINQGLFYLDWLMGHKADFKLLVLEKLGSEAAERIDWSSPAVYCIANSFGKYDLHAIKQMNRNIRLVRYARSEELILFEYLNSPSTSAPITKEKGHTSSADKAFREQYVGTTPQLREIVDEVRQYMSAMGNDVSENELKLYLAIKKARNIVCVEVNKSRVILHLKLDPASVEETNLVSDVSNKGHWGTGDIEVSLKTLDELEQIKPLLDRTYLEN